MFESFNICAGQPFTLGVSLRGLTTSTQGESCIGISVVVVIVNVYLISCVYVIVHVILSFFCGFVCYCLLPVVICPAY